jgi:hypothetical protein
MRQFQTIHMGCETAAYRDAISSPLAGARTPLKVRILAKAIQALVTEMTRRGPRNGIQASAARKTGRDYLRSGWKLTH